MKSWFLEELCDPARVRGELSNLLPNQVDPWVLLASDDDALAYFNVITTEAGVSHVQADISGRYYNRDKAVLEVLRELQKRLGGVVRDDDDNQL
jgi:hypothetical protein